MKRHKMFRIVGMLIWAVILVSNMFFAIPVIPFIIIAIGAIILLVFSYIGEKKEH